MITSSSKCIMWKDGLCNSDYGNKRKCNGHASEDCVYKIGKIKYIGKAGKGMSTKYIQESYNYFKKDKGRMKENCDK